ncbi:asparaginase [Aminobacter sp. HY435]|uniref:asparaginase n=1 Tax=Aminobacter sp. HY435 TaxID=2970917 RepID=UPI0022B94A20|nr:asparaginase [Aminobacter sp. HY435]
MTNPVLVEVLRGSLVESAHRGSFVVMDADGRNVAAAGDTGRPVFPRSAVKAIQALPFVESGAADAYGFGNREIALACASHSGEKPHTDVANAMLGKAGLDVGALECGAHWPDHETTVALARSGGSPTALHNNCSGKHSGFVCTCRHLGIDHRGYVRPGHRFQQMVRQAMEDVTGAAHNETNRGTDGCSIPTFAVPLDNLALGFARMTTGKGMSPERARAARRLLGACMAEPFMIAGTGRADTELMQAAPGRIFVKIGAEGVFCAAVPELGVGIALKSDDGAGRAAEAMIAAILAKLLASDHALAETLARASSPVLKNWNGIEVASLRPTAAFG